jgi:putative transcriptional regulator
MKKRDAKIITSKLIDEFKRIRQEKGLSHYKVAELSGLDRSTIGFIENKKRIPTILTCLKIADALEVSLADLLKSILDQ